MKTKITVIAILAMALVMMIGCGLVSEVESIKLVNAPNVSYTLNQKDDSTRADKFEVEVKVGGTTMNLNLTDSRLTVEGLVDGHLDTTTLGTKTLKITYMGVSITVSYVVVGTSTNELWEANTGNEDTNDGAELLYDLKNGGALEGEYNLAGKQWPGYDVLEGTLTITGTATIKNLTMTDAKVFDGKMATNGNKYGGSDAGFIGYVAAGAVLTVSDESKITFENVVIEHIDNTERENAKGFGVVVGTNRGTATINNVIVESATIKGNGALGGIVGYSAGTLTVDGCEVNVSITANNPVIATTEEGDGDKVGGILGSGQAAATITNNNVKVVLAATRDVGGVIGYASTGSTVTGNKVLNGSIISASVDGGMNEAKKGRRNVSGIIGSLAGANANGGTVITFSGNEVGNEVVIASNSKYVNSSAATYINFYGVINAGAKITIGEEVIEFKDYATQEAFIEAVNAYIAGLAA